MVVFYRMSVLVFHLLSVKRISYIHAAPRVHFSLRSCLIILNNDVLSVYSSYNYFEYADFLQILFLNDTASDDPIKYVHSLVVSKRVGVFIFSILNVLKRQFLNNIPIIIFINRYEILVLVKQKDR